MSPMTAAVLVFAVMWAVILYSGFRLYTWLYRLDRENREGKTPHKHGL